MKKNFTISMWLDGPDSTPGVGLTHDGTYYFVVDRYCRDLKVAFYALEQHLFPTTYT